jgi:hypothetical protein
MAALILISAAAIGGFVGALAGYLLMYRAFRIDLFNYEKKALKNEL